MRCNLGRKSPREASHTEMLGLLCEYVADESNDSQGDPARQCFLAELSAGLADLAGELGAISTGEVIGRLRSIYGSQADDFASDPVLVHIEACIEELERIRNQSVA